MTEEELPVRRQLGVAHRVLDVFSDDGSRRALAGFHEIRHDGFRLMAQRDPVSVRLLDPTRDMSGRFCYDGGP
jgi:hypothetical protein